MTRRVLLLGTLATLASLTLGGCKWFGQFHSSVKFSLETRTPKVGQRFEAKIDFLDETELPCAFVLLKGGDVVDEAALPTSGPQRVFLTAKEPGKHSVEFRRDGRMVAHQSIEVR